MIQTKLGGPSQPLVQIQVTRSQSESQFGQNPSLPILNQSINSHQPNATQGKPPVQPIQTIASGLMPPKQNVLLKQLLQNCPSAESGTNSPNSNTPGLYTAKYRSIHRFEPSRDLEREPSLTSGFDSVSSVRRQQWISRCGCERATDSHNVAACKQ